MQNVIRLALVGGLIAAVAVSSRPAVAIDFQAKVDLVANPIIKDEVAVGFVVGIVQDGQTQILGYGETKKGSGVVPDEKTVFEIGSVSKAFTGILLAQMVNAEEVKLDDLLQKYLPESVKVPVAEDKPITLEHLATHTSGLPRLPDNLAPADPTNPYADYTFEQMDAFLNGHKLRRAPGEYEYSNLGMGLLGRVLASRANGTYEELLVDRICKPLDLNDTRITLSDDQKQRLATPYNTALEPEKNWDIPTFAGAGAIRSTAADLLKLVSAALANDDRSLTKAIQLAQQKRHTIKGGQAIGLGWHIARDGITIWHNGMTGGYSSWISVVPSRHFGVVVLANTATTRTDELGELVTRIVAGDKVEPPKHAPARKVMEVDPAVLNTYAGYFAIIPQFGLTVTVEDGKLMVQATGQPKLQVFPESTTKFFYKVVDAQITFTPDADGKVNKLTLHQNGQNLEGTRKEKEPAAK